MNAPKMLPWLARKWGVSDARALELWQQACTDTKAQNANQTSSAYWGAVKTRMFDLLDGEVFARNPVIETPWLMINLNFLRFMSELRIWSTSLTMRTFSDSTH